MNGGGEGVKGDREGVMGGGEGVVGGGGCEGRWGGYYWVGSSVLAKKLHEYLKSFSYLATL